MSALPAAFHYDFWTFASSEVAWDLCALPLRFLHQPRGSMSVTASRGRDGHQMCLETTEELADFARHFRPTTLLVEGAREVCTDAPDSWSMQFILSPLHSGWVQLDGQAIRREETGSAAVRIARSVQASVAWNQPKAFPTLLGGFNAGSAEELECRLLEMLSSELMARIRPQVQGVADVLAEGGLYLGLRESLSERPLAAPSLASGLDRLHDYFLSYGCGEPSVIGASLAPSAERLEAHYGELLRLPRANWPALGEELVRKAILPGERAPSVRRPDETLGEFRLSSGSLILTRRRKRELEKLGYWIPVGTGDEIVLLPFERHGAAIGLSEECGVEIVVQREHGSRLREVVSALEETAATTMTAEDVLALYERALLGWPLGGLFGRSTGEFVALLARALGVHRS